jgi:Flp pilus assembly protein TadG
MSRRCLHALRAEEGQVLVFVVLAAGMLIAVLALVVDVGGWFQAQRRAQSVADAAALAAAPLLIDNPGAAPGTVATVADQNWPGSSVSLPAPPSPTSITVVARPPANGVLSPFGHLTPDISASATASIQAPAKLSAVAPIAVVCSGWCSSPTTWSSFPWNDGVPVTFTYMSGGTPGTSASFAPIQLPGVSTGNFATYVSCDASDPSSGACNQQSATAPGTFGRLCLRNGNNGGCRGANRLANALSRAADGTVHLIAIASPCSCGQLNVVGWGAGTFTNVSRGGQTVQLSVSFQRLLVDGKWTDSGGSSNPHDFGVRAIALTG